MSDEMSIRTPTYRVPRSRGVDPTTKKLLVTAVVLGAALLAVAGAYSLIGVHHHGGGGVPVIAALPGPLRVKPVNPGGMQISDTQADLFSAKSGASSEGTLAPPPETPAPEALRPPPPPAAHSAAAMAEPATRPASLPIPAVAIAPPAPAATQKPPAAVEAQPASPPAATGRQMVQLAALPTEQAANEEWARLDKRLGDLLHGRQPVIERADVSGRTWWRVRTGGFTDAAEAKAFCEKVRGKGAGCDVSK